MKGNQKKSYRFLSLAQAKQKISATAHRLASEIVGLYEARHRVASSDMLAALAQPSYDESTRDGFVIRVIDDSEQKTNQYQVVSEIPAGKPSGRVLVPGTACRIMTGGCVPEGSSRVVPYEYCVEHNGAVSIDDSSLQTKTTFIRKIGSEVAQGEQLVAGGVELQAGHLAMLASCGVSAVSVVVRPSVGYVCTGSELISEVDELRDGKKISSNAFLLGGILAAVNACPVNMGIVADNGRDLLNIFNKVGSDQLDAMITTGGMGPGKYDLVERALVEAGGTVIFNAIAMRPGKSFLFGTLGQTLFFGLPGPPHAVRTLLNELVGPALLGMQGVKDSWPQKVSAHMQHQVNIKRNDILHLKDGVLTLEAGRCSVRFAEPLEIGNCFILLPPGQVHYREGELVDIHLALDFCIA